MKILKFFQGFWKVIKKIAYALQPAMFSLLVLIMGIIFLDFLPQGQDAVLALSDYSFFPGQLLFLVVTLLWAIQVWYWARNVYILRHHSLKKSPYYPKWATRVLPRVLGIAAFLVTTYALYDMAPNGENNVLNWLAGLYLLMTILFYIFVHYRRIIFKLPELEVILKQVEEASKEKGCDPGFSQLPARSRRTLIILTIIATVPLVLFLISPQASTLVGAAAVAILCFSIWIPLGSWILLMSFRFKLPILLILLILAIIFNFWNDIHQVRVLDGQPDRMDFASRLENFLNKYPNAGDVPEMSPPLYIVSTEGGGIRAAYWTAIVLGKIQDYYPQFSKRLFAISSVSGGSLGSGVYTALVKERQQDDSYQNENNFFVARSSDMLSGDFLSPTVASMLTGDLLNELLPFPVKYFSRALAMEKSWEIAWKKTLKGKSNRFGEPLGNLWEGDTTCQVPVLFLNGTLVETGQRIIGSPIKINPNPTTTPDFADSLDIYQYIKSGKEMRLSTAIHNSARFAYVSPAGTLEGGLHVVDGGYFDNSGAITAIELVYAVRDKLKKMGKTAQLKVIMINNNPVPDTNGSTGDQALQAKSEIKPLRFSSGLLAPILTLLEVRTAHAAAAQDQLKRLVENNFGTYILLVPYKGKVTLPLGWSLSQKAIQEMNQQAKKSLEENWSKIIDFPCQW
jgi:hypothetical protein